MSVFGVLVHMQHLTYMCFPAFVSGSIGCHFKHSIDMFIAGYIVLDGISGTIMICVQA